MTTENNIYLKPCPFCGSHAVILKTDDTFPRYIVMCGNTVCPEQPMVETDSLEKGSFLWNSRPSEAAQDKEIKRLREALEEIQDAITFLNTADVLEHISDKINQTLEGEEE